MSVLMKYTNFSDSGALPAVILSACCSPATLGGVDPLTAPKNTCSSWPVCFVVGSAPHTQLGCDYTTFGQNKIVGLCFQMLRVSAQTLWHVIKNTASVGCKTPLSLFHMFYTGKLCSNFFPSQGYGHLNWPMLHVTHRNATTASRGVSFRKGDIRQFTPICPETKLIALCKKAKIL